MHPLSIQPLSTRSLKPFSIQTFHLPIKLLILPFRLILLLAPFKPVYLPFKYATSPFMNYQTIFFYPSFIPPFHLAHILSLVFPFPCILCILNQSLFLNQALFSFQNNLCYSLSPLLIISLSFFYFLISVLALFCLL